MLWCWRQTSRQTALVRNNPMLSSPIKSIKALTDSVLYAVEGLVDCAVPRDVTVASTPKDEGAAGGAAGKWDGWSRGRIASGQRENLVSQSAKPVVLRRIVNRVVSSILDLKAVLRRGRCQELAKPWRNEAWNIAVRFRVWYQRIEYVLDNASWQDPTHWHPFRVGNGDPGHLHQNAHRHDKFYPHRTDATGVLPKLW